MATGREKADGGGSGEGRGGGGGGGRGSGRDGRGGGEAEASVMGAAVAAPALRICKPRNSILRQTQSSASWCNG